MNTIRMVSWQRAVVVGLLLAGCSAPPPTANDDLADASSDGFLDVAPPDGVAFDENSNLKVKLISEIDASDVATVAQLQNVPQEWIALLPLVSIVATADLTLHYANDRTTEFTESAVVAPFEKAFEFACPERLNFAVRVDVFSPVGNLEPLFSDSSAELRKGEDFACGDVLVYRAYVDAEGDIHVELQP